MEEELKRRSVSWAPLTPEISKSKPAGNNGYGDKVGLDARSKMDNTANSNSKTSKNRKKMKRHGPPKIDKTKGMKWNVPKPSTPKQNTPRKKVDVKKTKNLVDQRSCSKRLDFDETEIIGNHLLSESVKLFLPTEKQREAAASNPSLFKCVLNLRPLAKIRKNRSYRSDLLNFFPVVKRRRSETSRTKLRNEVKNDLIEEFVSDILVSSIVQDKADSEKNVMAVQDQLDSDKNVMAVQDQADSDKNVMALGFIIKPKKCKVFKSVCSRRIIKTSPANCSLKLIPRNLPPNLAQDYILSRRDNVALPENLLNFVIREFARLRVGENGSHIVVRAAKVSDELVPLKRIGKNALGLVKKIVKKRNKWPKVVLDANDENDEEYWAKERGIFHLRAKFFIKCMNALLGDRRFSKWKGTVVASIVGVYLTQNVSDYLSSTVYMLLKAIYPSVFPSSQESTSSAHSGNSTASKVDESVKSTTNTSQESIEITEQQPTDVENKESHFFMPEEVALELDLEVGLETDFAGSQIEGDTVIVEDETVLESQESVTSGKCPSSQESVALGKCPSSQESVVLGKCPSCQESVALGKCPSSQESFALGKCPTNSINTKKGVKRGIGKKKEEEDWIEWSRRHKKDQTPDTIDSVEWEAIRQAKVEELAKVIELRGQHNIIAGRIKDFLNRMMEEHGCIDLEFLKDAPAKETQAYLLSIKGLGLKSVECVRLLGLQQHAFPVDTNVGRILVRLGWVPLKYPLPGNVPFHRLEQYPSLDDIQKYIWPRLENLTVEELYELHYHLITAGKIFCTKRAPNCAACPMKAECKHFASACASDLLRLQASQGEKNKESPTTHSKDPQIELVHDVTISEMGREARNCEPVIEMPPSPEPVERQPSPAELEMQLLEQDIEDFGCEYEDGIPVIKLNSEKFAQRINMESNGQFEGNSDMSKALLQFQGEVDKSALLLSSNPTTTQKHRDKRRSIYQVYELPDSHHLLNEFEKRDPADNCPYLLLIWKDDTKTPTSCDSGTCGLGHCVLCESNVSFQGTILIPCRTANRGEFPLNGTYFQVNEVFADSETCRSPILVPGHEFQHLKKSLLLCGVSVTSVCRGMSMEGVQYSFWNGFICVRGFNRSSRKPEMLPHKLHRWTSTQVNKSKK